MATITDTFSYANEAALLAVWPDEYSNTGSNLSFSGTVVSNECAPSSNTAYGKERDTGAGALVSMEFTGYCSKEGTANPPGPANTSAAVNFTLTNSSIVNDIASLTTIISLELDYYWNDETLTAKITGNLMLGGGTTYLFDAWDVPNTTTRVRVIVDGTDLNYDYYDGGSWTNVGTHSGYDGTPVGFCTMFLSASAISGGGDTASAHVDNWQFVNDAAGGGSGAVYYTPNITGTVGTSKTTFTAPKK